MQYGSFELAELRLYQGIDGLQRTLYMRPSSRILKKDRELANRSFDALDELCVIVGVDDFKPQAQAVYNRHKSVEVVRDYALLVGMRSDELTTNQKLELVDTWCEASSTGPRPTLPTKQIAKLAARQVVQEHLEFCQRPSTIEEVSTKLDKEHLLGKAIMSLPTAFRVYGKTVLGIE